MGLSEFTDEFAKTETYIMFLEDKIKKYEEMCLLLGEAIEDIAYSRPFAANSKIKKAKELAQLIKRK